MRIEQDHDRLHASDVAQLESLSDLIPAALISLLGEEGLVTLHPRRLSITPLFLSLPCRTAAQIRRYNQGRVAALVGSDWLSSASCTVSRLTWGA
ncbi:hypothetical protein D3C76_1321340 [compost metagenome]